MSPAHVLEPTYERLKQSLLNGVWAQETRLEAQRLAEDFGVSMTPVRDCLNRLVGEGLVEFRPGEGYRVPRMTEKGLRDMLELSGVLIVEAIQSGTPQPTPKPKKPRLSGYAERVSAVLLELAGWSHNAAFSAAIARVNEHLHLLRTVETGLLPDGYTEIENIAELAFSHSTELSSAVFDFHQVRRIRTAELIELLETR
ncbi:GntR family transcriptional regulator [Erythrobacter aureus]|uniref:GntR family transcriptional regulator n=1 Tax=Erythrobacter aureus TaxID=2182384 RepID=A0A345YBM1_9SPHN|nr:GntR family transcriptional regulator [Erythrobacter aureus]AXK41323.1 GntR family transcriptional regulator [Erythrobacter aureus]